MKIIEMTEAYAKAIEKWVYPAPYEVYNMSDCFSELMDNYYAIIDESLIGFLCIGKDAQVPPGNYNGSAVDFGLGMDPEKCGTGMGVEFVKTCINFVKDAYQLPLRLTVLSWNKRALHLYRNLGFEWQNTYKKTEKEFYIMIQKKGD